MSHPLVEHASESTLLLENGCVCCAMRNDLKTALKDLHSRRARGEIPRYDRHGNRVLRMKGPHMAMATTSAARPCRRPS